MSDHESSSDRSADDPTAEPAGESARESVGEPAGGSTDEPVDESASAESATADTSADPAPTESGRRGKRSVLRYLEWAGLALCSLLVLVAGLRVYSGVGAFISLWVASRYEPIVSAGFNLAVLLAAAYGAAILSRRLTSSS